MWTQLFYLHGNRIVFDIPDRQKDDTDDQEQKSCEQNAKVVTLFQLCHLSLAVVTELLVIGSAIGHKPCQNDVSEHVRDTDQRALAADKDHARIQGQKQTRNGKSVRQYLHIDRRTVRKEALKRKHANRKSGCNAKADQIADQ